MVNYEAVFNTLRHQVNQFMHADIAQQALIQVQRALIQVHTPLNLGTLMALTHIIQERIAT